MNKKGFTLVELLAVIAIMGILLIIAVPKLLGEIKTNKEQALENYKEIIISAARNYVIDKNLKVPVSISITQLCDEEYLSCPIINPVDDTTMSGYINIDVDKNYAYADTAANERTNTKLNNVRYIKNCINGSTANSNNHWLEIKAMSYGENVSVGKTVTSTGTPQTGKSLSLVTNNFYTTDETQIFRINENSGLQCVTVDLSKTYNLDSITVWHYYGDTRNYYSNTTYVSSDNTTWIPVTAGFYTETGQGKTVTAYESNATVTPIYRVSNLIINGSFENGVNNWNYSAGLSSVANSSKFGNYLLQNYHSVQYGHTDQGVNVVVGNKYYASVWMYSQTIGTGVCYNDTSFYYDSVHHWYGFGGSQTNMQVWEKKSQIYTTPSVSSPQIYLAILPYSQADAVQECYADGVTLVDLTATFGVGNEPSKAWCDTNLNYFDGSQNFNLSL